MWNVYEGKTLLQFLHRKLKTMFQSSFERFREHPTVLCCSLGVPYHQPFSFPCLNFNQTVYSSQVCSYICVCHCSYSTTCQSSLFWSRLYNFNIHGSVFSFVLPISTIIKLFFCIYFFLYKASLSLKVVIGVSNKDFFVLIYLCLLQF